MYDFLPEFSWNPETGTFFFFAFFVCIQLLFTLFIYSRLAFHRTKNHVVNDLPPVSIIIAARNESENLYKHLPFILEQDYPNFEVIVVNHQSQDDTKYILDAYQKQYKNLEVVSVEKNKHLSYGKKLAITLGIKRAKHEHLLLTDADCKPASAKWISGMAAEFTQKKQIVLGYGPYTKTKGFLNRLIRFDTAWIGMNYLSFAKASVPYMGIGRNLAYTKTSFEKAGGFKSHYSISSGDDDLFIQDAAKRKNYTISLISSSYCFSPAPTSWKSWFNQKSRHFTTSSHYKVIKKLMLGIYPFSLLMVLLSFVILMFNSNFRWLTLAIYLFLVVIKWIIQGKAFVKLNERKFIPFLPLWDVFYTIWAPVMFYSINKKDANKW